ncbi:MAG: hypothetical protein ACTSQ8_24045 [Candidatus Helarchaeota archaeon]
MIPKKFLTQFGNIISSSNSFSEFDTRIKLLPNLPSFLYFRNYVLYTSEKIEKLIHRLTSESDFIHDHSGTSEMKSLRISSPHENTLTYVIFLPTEQSTNILRLFTIANYDLSEKIKHSFKEMLYPSGIFTFFRQEEIYKAIKKFEIEIIHNYSLIVTDAVLKGKDKDPYYDSYIHTERSWKKQTIDEAFDEAKERHEWFSSIKFSINKKIFGGTSGKKIADCRVFKNGEIYYSGFNSFIEESLINELVSFVYQRMNKFQHRGIRERNYDPGLPLEILYDFDRFNELEEVRRFGATLSSYPDSSIAVFHSNPYYHANIADFLDGSSFDIWILSSKRILIKPQLKATPQAIEKLVSYISSEFAEGDIREYSG